MIARSGVAGPRSIAEGDAESITRPRAAIASRIALAMLGAFFVSACEKTMKPADKTEPDQLAPVIIVTKTDMVDGGVVVARDIVQRAIAVSAAPEATVHIDCDAVAAKVPSVLFSYDPGYFAFAAQIRPKVRESCIGDEWPEPLRRCIVTAKPDALAHDHACGDLVSVELAEKVSQRFGIPLESLPHAAQSPTTIAP